MSRGHPDGPALDVLSDLLTCGRRGRLHASLVEHGRLATWVDAAQDGSRRAGQFVIQVEATPEATPQRIEQEVARVLAELADAGPTCEELARARHRLEAAWRWEQEDLAGLAAGLGQVALWDDWRAWQAEHRAALSVGPDDIRRVASTYLTDSCLTVGWSLPRPSRTVAVLVPGEASTRPRGTGIETASPTATAGSGSTSSSRALHQLPATSSSEPVRDLMQVLAKYPTRSRLNTFRPRRDRLDNGMRLVSERRAGTGIVALELFVDAGVLREAKPGLAHLTGRLLEEGTETRSADALAESIEDVGGTLDVSSTGASLRVRAEDLPLAIEILAELVRRPALPVEALGWVRRRIAAELQADRDDPSYRADLLFRGLVYGEHPYARDPRGGSRDLKGLTLDDVRAHHARYFVPDNAFLVTVGDFEPRRLRTMVQGQFGSWVPGGQGRRPIPRPTRRPRPRVRRVPHPGEQVQIVLGHLGIRRNHPDFVPLAVLDHIFGSGPGFSDRLSRIVRDEMGLAYSIGGGITDTADMAPGMFRVTVGTMPEESDRVVAAIVEQVRAMHAGEFSDEEVEHARRYLAGSWVFDFQTVEQRAERLLELERYGIDLDEPLRWPEQVAAVTPRQVRRAARIHIDPNALARVEFGPIRPHDRNESRPAECA